MLWSGFLPSAVSSLVGNTSSATAGPSPSFTEFSASPSPAAPGSTVTYKIVLKNPTFKPVTGRLIFEPGGTAHQLSILSADVPGYKITSMRKRPSNVEYPYLEWNKFTSYPLSTKTIHVRVRSKSSIPEDSYSSKIWYTANIGSTNTGLDIGAILKIKKGVKPIPTPTPTPTPTPEVQSDRHGISIDKSDGDRTVTRPDHTINYTVTVENTGTVDIHDLSLTDELSSLFTLVSASDNGQLNGQTLTWHNIALDAGEKRTFTYTVRVKSTAPNGSQICNDITARSNDFNLSDNDEDCVTVQHPPKVAAAQVIPVTPTAKTGASALALLSTILGSGGLMVIRKQW